MYFVLDNIIDVTFRTYNLIDKVVATELPSLCADQQYSSWRSTTSISDTCVHCDRVKLFLYGTLRAIISRL